MQNGACLRTPWMFKLIRHTHSSFHCLPLKNKNLLYVRIHKKGRKNLPLNSNSQVCIIHFNNAMNRILRPDKFPIINLPTHTMPVHKRNLPTKRLFEENVARNADDKENTDYVAATDAIVQTCGPSNLCSCSQLRGEICILQQKLALSLFRLSTIHLTIKISGPTVECLNYRGSRKDGKKMVTLGKKALLVDLDLYHL